MENNQERLSHQQEMLRDLQSQLSQATSEDEKRAIQLKMNVVDAKIKELQAKQSSAPVNEGTPENTKDFHNELTDEQLDEGCMSKKFENMSNREVAKYIFGHPHTKFAGKMKECDYKEILKAIRDIKKANEEAPVTNTTAVANTEVPSMYMKRKLK